MCGLGLSPLATLSTETTNLRTRSFVSSHLAKSGFVDRTAANSRTAASLSPSPTAGNASGSPAGPPGAASPSAGWTAAAAGAGSTGGFVFFMKTK